jgi:hypothetical protein
MLEMETFLDGRRCGRRVVRRKTRLRGHIRRARFSEKQQLVL